MTDYNDLDALTAELDESSSRIADALRGSLVEEYRGIRSLDPETIKDITPDITDEATYEKLMRVVQEASARNESQAQLAERIQRLGDIAVKIAKRIPQLAKLL